MFGVCTIINQVQLCLRSKCSFGKVQKWNSHVYQAKATDTDPEKC